MEGWAADLERERRDSDLLYALFTEPQRPTKDGPLLDRTLRAALDLVNKKYAPTIGASRIVGEGQAWLRSTQDATAKLFAFLCMLAREPELQELVRVAYRPGNVWAGRHEKHFADWLAELQRIVRQTMHWPCTELNMPRVMHDMVATARKAYIMP
jgi:hypothetical protein